MGRMSQVTAMAVKPIAHYGMREAETARSGWRRPVRPRTSGRGLTTLPMPGPGRRAKVLGEIYDIPRRADGASELRLTEIARSAGEKPPLPPHPQPHPPQSLPPPPQ